MNQNQTAPKELTAEEAKAKKAAAIEARKNGTSNIAVTNYPNAATSVSDFVGPNYGENGEPVVAAPAPTSGPEAAIAAKNAKAEAQRKKEQEAALKKAEEEEAAKIADAKAKIDAANATPPAATPPKA